MEASPDLPSTSMMSDDSPDRAAARATVAETVVLPTPPLPATMSRREAVKNGAGSTPVPSIVGLRPEALALRRLPTLAAALITLAVVMGGFSALAGPAAARPGSVVQESGDDAGRVSIIKVEGLIDPVMASFIDRSISEGEAAGVVAVVLQMDSSGSVVDDDVL